METVIFRRANESDLPSICELGQLVNALHHEAHPFIFTAQSSPERDAEHWRQGIFGPGAAGFVAELHGAVVAFVNAEIIVESRPLLQPCRFLRIGSLCVAETQRRQSIGSRLMSLIERWGEDEGATDVRLNVWAFNESARRMYGELGYEVRSLALGKRTRQHGG